MRETKTTRTRSKKQRYWGPGVRHTYDNLLAVQAEIFGGPTPAEPVRVAWPELEQDPADEGQGGVQIDDDNRRGDEEVREINGHAEGPLVADRNLLGQRARREPVGLGPLKRLHQRVARVVQGEFQPLALLHAP